MPTTHRAMNRATIFAAILGILLGTSGLLSGRIPPAVAAGPTITIAMVSDVNTLDPAVSSSFYDRYIMNNVYDKLFDLNTKGKIVPVLALGYKVSHDRRTYTLSLRKRVKFTDGTTFNADAVKFNLDRYRLPTSAPRAAELKLVDGVTTAGAYTVKIHLTDPFSPLISILTDRSGMMCSPKAVQSEGAAYASQPVGTGPFTLQERVKGDHITLAKNPRYWRHGFPKASQVVWKIFTDPNVQLVNLQSGVVDFMDTVTAQNIPAIKHAKSLSLVNKAGYGWNGFWLNTKTPALSNPLVRQAISILVDRKQLINVTGKGLALPADSPFGPGDLAYGPWDKAPKPSVKLARQLLSKAHVSDVTFTYKTTTAAISQQIGEVIQQQLAAGGITMKIETEDFTTLLTQLGQHNFEAAAVGWSGRPDPDQNSYNHFITGGPNNYGQYSNATVDRYLNAGRKQVDAKKRKADYAKVAETLAKQAPYVFISHGNNAFAMKAKVKGFVYVPDGIIRAVGMTK